jgi:hypothetical protein
MARRVQTYAIRLAVEGGGQVKAELVSVGQSGEQSLKRIETAGGRASGGLRDLGRQSELLRTGIRTLGGALAGVATVGGLAALVATTAAASPAPASCRTRCRSSPGAASWWCPPERVVREEKSTREQRPITVVVNVTAADASSFRASQGQIAADMARAIDRASRNR